MNYLPTSYQFCSNCGKPPVLVKETSKGVRALCKECKDLPEEELLKPPVYMGEFTILEE